MLTDQETQTGIDFYKVLNVDPSADAEVIRAAYRALARREHPDVSLDPDAAMRMVELNAAFDVLGDPERRAEYDYSRRVYAVTANAPLGRRFAPGAPGPSASGPAASAAPAPASEPTSYQQPLASRAAPAQGQTGTVLDFGRYSGRSLADLAREDPDYLEWLARTMIGRPYQPEIERLLAVTRSRPLSVSTPAKGRKGLFGRILG